MKEVKFVSRWRRILSWKFNKGQKITSEKAILVHFGGEMKKCNVLWDESLLSDREITDKLLFFFCGTSLHSWRTKKKLKVVTAADYIFNKSIQRWELWRAVSKILLKHGATVQFKFLSSTVLSVFPSWWLSFYHFGKAHIKFKKNFELQNKCVK